MKKDKVTPRFVIVDNSDNSFKPYLTEDLHNTGDPECAWIFESEAEAEEMIKNSGLQDWASVMEL